MESRSPQGRSFPPSASGFLVVLAGGRALPSFLRGYASENSLSHLLNRAVTNLSRGVPEELAARLLDALGRAVTAVELNVTTADSTALDPHAWAALIWLGWAGPVAGVGVKGRRWSYPSAAARVEGVPELRS